MTEDKSAQFHRIGAGFCGTVWARGPDTSVFKREDGGPERSLQNDFDMHQRALSSVKNFTIQIPKCYRFIPPTDTEWWNDNLPSFPKGYSPCNTIQSQRIPPFPETVRAFLVERYCPPELRGHIMSSDTNKDCLIRPYLGRRRTQQTRLSKFKAFSLRNYPLHIDQMEEIGISSSDMRQYTCIMAEALAIMHWIGEMDGNDVEFVLAPPDPQAKGTTTSNSLGEHAIWMLDFDLCRMMAMDEGGVKQAVIAFWRNDPFTHDQKVVTLFGKPSVITISLLAKIVSWARNTKTRRKDLVCQGFLFICSTRGQNETQLIQVWISNPKIASRKSFAETTMKTPRSSTFPRRPREVLAF